MVTRLYQPILASVYLMLVSPSCWSVDAYGNVAAPQASYFVAYPMYYRADAFNNADGRKTATPEVEAYQTILRYVHYDKKRLPHTWNFNAYIPVGCVKAFDQQDCGVGDLTAVVAYWLIDDPDSKTWLAVGSYLDIPIGHYDVNRVANMGNHVWKYRPLVGFAKQIGNVDLELSFKYNVYSRNSANSFEAGDEIIVESFLGYYFQPDLLIGIHLNGTFGRNNTVRNIEIPDSGIQRYQAGVSLTKLIGPRFNLMLEALQDFGVQNGLEGTLLIGRLAWRY